jgi:hypothetical protein
MPSNRDSLVEILVPCPSTIKTGMGVSIRSHAPPPPPGSTLHAHFAPTTIDFASNGWSCKQITVRWTTYNHVHVTQIELSITEVTMAPAPTQFLYSKQATPTAFDSCPPCNWYPNNTLPRLQQSVPPRP